MTKQNKKIIKNNKNKTNKLSKTLKSFWEKNVSKNKNKFTLKEIILFMVIIFVIGILFGGIIMYIKLGNLSREKTSLNEFIMTYSDILNNYYLDIDEKELLDAGIEGMVSYLGDPYASYMDKEESMEFSETVEGKYSGIGAEISYNYVDGIATISSVFEKGPAEKAGLKPNDVLKEINGESVEGKNHTEIANIVKGQTDTKVTIKVLRNNEELEFTVKRDKVDYPSVKKEIYEEKNKKIGYLAISIFADNTYEQFKNELEKLEKENIDSLIIDVRGNSGGYLTSVTDILSLFTEKGSIIYKLKTKDEIESIKDKTKESRNYPIVVLTDIGSASASEVLASGLKENNKATIIGTKTFGKGKVQKSYKLSNGTIIKYTHQEWLTPNGNSIDAVGVEPNKTVPYIYEPNAKIDNQLQEAIKEISQK